MNNDIDFEDDSGDQIPFLLKIPKVNQSYQIKIPKDFKISDFFNSIAELTHFDIKILRLISGGQRVANDPNKTIGEEFQGDSNVEREITVFTESQGASI